MEKYIITYVGHVYYGKVGTLIKKDDEWIELELGYDRVIVAIEDVEKVND